MEKNNSSSSLTHKLASLNFGGINKDSSGHKRAFSLPSRSEKKETNIRVGGSLTKSGVQQFQVDIFFQPRNYIKLIVFTNHFITF